LRLRLITAPENVTSKPNRAVAIVTSDMFAAKSTQFNTFTGPVSRSIEPLNTQPSKLWFQNSVDSFHDEGPKLEFAGDTYTAKTELPEIRRDTGKQFLLKKNSVNKFFFLQQTDRHLVLRTIRKSLL